MMKFTLLTVLLCQSFGAVDAQGSQARLGSTTTIKKGTKAQTSQSEWEARLAKGIASQITIHSDTAYQRPATTTTKSTMDVSHDICLSANFTLDGQVVVDDPGWCPGGVRPYLAMYPARDCVGAHSHPRWWDPWQGTPGLFSRQLTKGVWNMMSYESPVNQWSMVLRCMGNNEAKTAQGAKEFWNITLPVAPPPPPEKPKTPTKPKTKTTVSDSACWTSDINYFPRHLYQHLNPDICLNIPPKRKLKIYNRAACPDGQAPQLTTYKNKGCVGLATWSTEVTDDLLQTCIAMDEDKWSSYAFICTGHITQEDVPSTLFPTDESEHDGEMFRIDCGNSGCRMVTSEKQKTKSSGSLTWVPFVIGGLVIITIAGVIVLVKSGLIARTFEWVRGRFSREGRIVLD